MDPSFKIPKVTDLAVYKSTDGEWYMSLTCEGESKYWGTEMNIPKIHLDFSKAKARTICRSSTSYYSDDRIILDSDDVTTMEFDFGTSMNIEMVGDRYFTARLTDYPVQMTIEDIEKELGYKIAIAKGD